MLGVSARPGLSIEHTKVSLHSLTVYITKHLLRIGVRRKLTFFGHTIRDGGCELVKCAIQGKVNGKRRHGRHKTSYSSNITTWMAESMEQIPRDGAGWRRSVLCATRAADLHPDGIGKRMNIVWYSCHHSFDSFHMPCIVIQMQAQQSIESVWFPSLASQ